MLKQYRKTTKLYKNQKFVTMHIFKYNQGINLLSLYKEIELENWWRIFAHGFKNIEMTVS